MKITKQQFNDLLLGEEAAYNPVSEEFEEKVVVEGITPELLDHYFELRIIVRVVCKSASEASAAVAKLLKEVV